MFSPHRAERPNLRMAFRLVHWVRGVLQTVLPTAAAGGDDVDRSRVRRFSLVSWFAALSFVSILLISVVAAGLLSRFLGQSLLERDSAIMQQMINNIVAASDSYEYFAEGSVGSADLEGFFARMGDMPGVMRANAYAQDRTIIWSTEPEIVGRRFDPNDELEDAFRGNPQVETGVAGARAKLEHTALSTPGTGFIENYLPIWHGDGPAARVVGVVELYRTPDSILNEIKAGKRFVWMGAALAGLFLYATLFWLIRRANTVMLQQEQQLIEAKTLATLGEMASAVAHSLRNPLASIRSSAELALESRPAPDVRSLLTDVVEQSDRLASWVRQYLSETNIVGAEPDSADVQDVISSSIDNFLSEFGRRDVRQSSRIDPGLPPAAIGHLVLGQVLNGLIANAIEAMTSGGTLSITARLQDSRLRIDVVDTGPGIAPDDLPDLLQPFKTTKNAGLGLGLPLAKRLIERHGGRLTLSSELGSGTTATLLLPTGRPPASSRAAA